MKNRLSERADAWGTHLLIFLCCMLLFLLLWGVRLPALTAGMALYLFLITLRRTGREKRLRRREINLRRRLGGELALERLLVQQTERTHFEAALLLSSRFQFQLLRITEEGVLCRKEGKTLLVHYAQLHEEDTLSGAEVARLQRLCPLYRCDEVWLCAPCHLSPQARAQCRQSPALHLIDRDALILLFGAAAPATDSQLVMLSRRRKKPMPVLAWLGELLSPRNAPAFARYAALMAALLFLTGQKIYGCSAVMMMTLCALCRLSFLRIQKAPPGGSV